MDEPTLHSLELKISGLRGNIDTMESNIRGDIKLVLNELENVKSRQDKHETQDATNLAAINDNLVSVNLRINDVMKYAISIATVAAAIGAGVSWFWEYAKNKAGT